MPKYRFEQIAINSTEKKKPVDSDKATYIGLEHLDSGSLKVVHYGADAAPAGDKLVMKKGDVLFGKRRAYQKKVAIAPFDGIFSAHGMVLRPRVDVVHPDFFPFFIASDYFLDAAIKISVGSLSPTINWRDLARLDFILPDLETQAKQAEILWAITKAKESYEELITATDDLVKSQFVEMFGDPVQNDKMWEMKQIKELYSVGSSKRVYASELTSEGVPFLRVSDICSMIDGGCVQPSLFITEDKYKDFVSHELTPTENDILVTARGTIGRCYIVGASDKFYFQDGMVTWLKKKGYSIEPIYITNLFATDSFIDVLDKATNKTTVHYISIDKLASLMIPVPPIEMQRTYASIVAQADKSKFAAQQALADLIATQKALLRENLG